MKIYFGIKLVEAEPCKLWKLTENHPIGDDGYKVKYEDGYVSWSPKDIFEKSYFETHKMNFGQAIAAMRIDLKVQREGWNGKGMWLALQKPDEHSKMTAPYIYMKTADNKLVPWLASQTDMLAEDWQIVG